MSEIAAKYGVSSIELNALVSMIFGNDAFAIGEKLYWDGSGRPDHFGRKDGMRNPSDWDKGRVFDEKSEIRWEKDGEAFHVVMISDSGAVPAGWEKESLHAYQGVRDMVLWGECCTDQPGKWYEKQIPRFLDYPAEPMSERVCIRVQEYETSGSAETSRVYRFKEVLRYDRKSV